jgi:hypothetical protein
MEAEGRHERTAKRLATGQSLSRPVPMSYTSGSWLRPVTPCVGH